MELKKEVYINGKYNEVVSTRLLNFIIEDNIGLQLDALELSINNSDDGLSIPQSKATIEIAIGYSNDIYKMGQFVAKSINATPTTIGINCIAQDLSKGRVKHNRVFKDQSLENILKTLANDLGLSLQIDSNFKGQQVSYYLQENKTTLEIIAELSAIFYALVNVKDNNLVFISKNNNKSITILENNILSMVKRDSTTNYYNGVIYNSWNISEGKLESNKKGAEPYLILQNVVDSSLQNTYINSKYQEIQEKEGIKLSIQGNPQVQAGFKFSINSAEKYSQFNGDYRIEYACHIYNGIAYTTSIDAIKINKN